MTKRILFALDGTFFKVKLTLVFVSVTGEWRRRGGASASPPPAASSSSSLPVTATISEAVTFEALLKAVIERW